MRIVLQTRTVLAGVANAREPPPLVRGKAIRRARKRFASAAIVAREIFVELCELGVRADRFLGCVQGFLAGEAGGGVRGA